MVEVILFDVVEGCNSSGNYVGIDVYYVVFECFGYFLN